MKNEALISATLNTLCLVENQHRGNLVSLNPQIWEPINFIGGMLLPQYNTFVINQALWQRLSDLCLRLVKEEVDCTAWSILRLIDYTKINQFLNFTPDEVKTLTDLNNTLSYSHGSFIPPKE